jgi:hypothetical protein
MISATSWPSIMEEMMAKSASLPFSPSIIAGHSGYGKSMCPPRTLRAPMASRMSIFDDDDDVDVDDEVADSGRLDSLPTSTATPEAVAETEGTGIDVATGAVGKPEKPPPPLKAESDRR